MKKKKRGRRLTTILLLVVMAFIMFISSAPLSLLAEGEEPQPICGLEEHIHGPECYRPILNCGQMETDAHTHDEDCYSVTGKLPCKYANEHVHDSSCFETKYVNGEEVKYVVCGHVMVPRFESTEDSRTEREAVVSEGHHHTETCYTIPDEPDCGIPGHARSASCYPREGHTITTAR